MKNILSKTLAKRQNDYINQRSDLKAKYRKSISNQNAPLQSYRRKYHS